MGSVLNLSVMALCGLSSMNESKTLPQLVASRTRFKCTSFQKMSGLGERVKMPAPLNIFFWCYFTGTAVKTWHIFNFKVFSLHAKVKSKTSCAEDQCSMSRDASQFEQIIDSGAEFQLQLTHVQGPPQQQGSL